MNQQDRETYDKIKALIASGAELSFALHYHQVSEKRWQQLCEQLDAPALDSAEYHFAFDTINTTAQAVRNLMITFLFVMGFVLVTLLSIDDKALFLNNQVTLPLINIGVSAENFFVGIPLMLIVLHGNFLFNLYVMRHKVRRFHFVSSNYFFPFLIVQTIQTSNLQPVIKNLGQVITAILLISPTILLVMISSHFAIYQSLAISIYHNTILIMDVALFFLIWVLISKNDAKQHILIDGAVPKSLMLKGAITLFYYFIIIYLYTVTLADSCDPDSIKSDQMCINETKRPSYTMYESSFSFPAGTDFTQQKPTPLWIYNQVTNPSDEATLEQYLNRFAKGPDLADRNLRFLDCQECGLQKADLRKSNLSGASVKSSNFSWSDMSNIRIYGADFSGTNLSNIKLADALIMGGSFDFANFTNAQFKNTLFKNTSIYGTSFNTSLNQVYIFNSTAKEKPNKAYMSSDGRSENNKKNLIGGSIFGGHFCDYEAPNTIITSDSLVTNITDLKVTFSRFNKLQIRRSQISNNQWRFVDISNSYLSEIRVEESPPSKSQSSDNKNSQSNQANKTGQFSEINVTNTVFDNSIINTQLTFTDAFCLKVNTNGVALPPKSQNVADQATFAKEKWPLCRPWPKEPIPCGDNEKMDALIAKTLKQPVQYCYVGQDGLCRLNQQQH